jgi:carbonic anhydrase
VPSALKHLLDNNKAWSERLASADPNYFPRLAAQQSPQYLWIGCSDSRVPANEIVGLMPGELFVHRNVANIVVHTDLNCLSVLQYAVDVLRVQHVIVCGHYGCGGVKSALDEAKLGLIDNWLRHVQDVRNSHREQLDALDGEARSDRLCELNALAQARHVCETTVIQDAWARFQAVEVHAVIYGLRDGRLRDLGFSTASERHRSRGAATSRREDRRDVNPSPCITRCGIDHVSPRRDRGDADAKARAERRVGDRERRNQRAAAPAPGAPVQARGQSETGADAEADLRAAREAAVGVARDAPDVGLGDIASRFSDEQRQLGRGERS